jgi:hypothetical protein
MTGKNLPESPLPPRAPNYANARGRAAARDNEGIVEDANPDVSPGSVPEPVERASDVVSEGRHDARQFHDKNYAQYMNQGDGRYLKFMDDQTEGSFGPDSDHGGETKQIHRLKSDKLP